MTTILIAGLTPASRAAAEEFRAAGHRVYISDIAHAPALLEEIKSPAGTDLSVCAEKGEDKLDILVFAPEKTTSDGDAYSSHDPEALYGQMQHNISGFYEVVEAAKDLLRKGQKRICVLTERSASVRRNTDAEDFGYHMSLAAVNMMEKIYFNALRPEGFTFRCFAADGEGGLTPAQYFTMPLCYDPSEPYTHSDENRLAFRDGLFDEIAW